MTQDKPPSGTDAHEGDTERARQREAEQVRAALLAAEEEARRSAGERTKAAECVDAEVKRQRLAQEARQREAEQARAALLAAEEEARRSAEARNRVAEHADAELRRQRLVQEARQRAEERARHTGAEASKSRPKDESYYWNILGLSPGASEGQIKQAFRKLIAEYHPDHVATLGKKLQDLAHQESIKIEEARAYLLRGLGRKPGGR